MVGTYDATYFQERLATLRTERSPCIPHWKDLSDHFLPWQSRFFLNDRNRKSTRANNKIWNEAGTLALRTLSSGMMSGMTNPARPWLALRTPDPDLNEYQPVKLWLDTVRTRMLEVFLRSNIYTTLPVTYRDLGCFGTSAYFLLDDAESLIRAYHFPVGSYMVAVSERGVVDTCYREFQMTARQMVTKFGEKQCSPIVQKLAKEAGGKETWINIIHAVEPNPDYNPRRSQFSDYKLFKSCFFEEGASGDKFLRTSGFDRFPVLAPRWDVNGEDAYGYSPAMDALGTNKQLQLREKRKATLIDKGSNPPLSAPESLRNQRSSVLPGDITYYSQGANGQKMEPIYLPQPEYYRWVLEDISSCERRISRSLFEDLFLMISNIERTGVTAHEIAAKQEEKLLQLGPVLLRQNDEHYDPLVDMTFEYMAKKRIIPPPPQELRGMNLGVEYISILSQAMKLVGVSSIERLTGYVGQLAAVKPDALDLFDADEAVLEYANVVGASPKLTKDKQVVAQVRDARQKQQQAMLMAQQMAASAKPIADVAGAVKSLAGAPAGGNNAMTQIMARLQGQPAPAEAAAA